MTDSLRTARFATAATALTLAVAMVACGPTTSDTPGTSARPERPNVLLVMVDDMGFTDIGSFGSEIETPHIDALAEEGVRFTNFRVSVSCSPTRSMLLSGVDNHLAGLGTMGEMFQPFHEGQPGYEGYHNDRVVSLAEVLRDGGYHTYMAGKWHLGHGPGRYPANRGFERTLSLLFGGASHWDDMSGLILPETPAYYTMNETRLDSLPADFYSSKNYADFVMESVRENHGDGQPFFAYLSLTAPHDPLHVPEPWRSKYAGRYDDGYEALKAQRVAGAKRAGVVPESAEVAQRHPMVRPWDSLSADERAWETAQMQVYAGMMDNADYHIGRVINFLKDIGEYDNTVVVFLSDNGPNPWTSDEYPTNLETGFLDQFDNRVENIGHKTSHSAYGMGWATASAGPLNLFKMSVGEGGIKVPLIIAGPGVTGGGRISTSFSYVTDLMPTLLELTGLRHPVAGGDADLLPPMGQSMAGVLAGSTDAVHEPGTLIAGEMFGGRWISDGTHKAVLVVPPYGSDPWELYNVSDDPGEVRDLAQNEPELLQRLITAWDEYAESVGVVFPPPGEDQDVEADFHSLEPQE